MTSSAFRAAPRVTRDEAVALYGEESRAAMEKLRAYAIKHRRGFTLDVEIRPALATPRWMRLIAAPVCAGDRIVRLQGLKFIVPPRDQAAASLGASASRAGMAPAGGPFRPGLRNQRLGPAAVDAFGG